MLLNALTERIKMKFLSLLLFFFLIASQSVLLSFFSFERFLLAGLKKKIAFKN